MGSFKETLRKYHQYHLEFKSSPKRFKFIEPTIKFASQNPPIQ